MAYLFILIRIILNPIANAFQKQLINREASPAFVVFISYAMLAVLSAIIVLFTPLSALSTGFWINIFLASVIDGLGNLFSVKSLKSIDLSVFGPLNAYKPVFATVTGAVLLHEIPSLLGAIGIIIVILGSYLINYQSGKKKSGVQIKAAFHSPGFLYRLLAIACYAIAVVYLKKAVIVSSPLVTLLFWGIIGMLVLGVNTIVTLKRTDLQKNYIILKNQVGTYVMLAVFFIFTQWVSLFIFEKLFVGYALAVFQLSAFIHIIIGYKVFKEANMKYKIIGTLVMISGVLLILTQ